jgi:hypothetical protein
LVIRLNELQGVDTEAIVELDSGLVDGLTEATTLDLMERPAEGKASFVEGVLRVSVKGNSFTTVRIS